MSAHDDELVVAETEESTTSRRALLAGLGLVAGAAGLTSLGRSDDVRVEPASSTRQAAAAASSRVSISVYGADWRIVRPGVAPGTMPPIGSPSLPHGRLVDAAGNTLGTFESSLLVTTGQGTQLQQLHFTDGTITAVGPSTFADATFAVIGGTGRFAGATGTYHLHQSPAPSGGTAEFTINITTAEA